MALKSVTLTIPEVDAVLAGRKTMLRIPVKMKYALPVPGQYKRSKPPYKARLWDNKLQFVPFDVHESDPSPYELYEMGKAPFAVGDLVGVKEEYQRVKNMANSFAGYIYRTDYPEHTAENIIWATERMPKKAIRLWLRITDIRTEKLLDITEDDCLAEGVKKYIFGNPERPDSNFLDYRKLNEEFEKISYYLTARQSYQTLWERIHGAGSWDKNDWVFVVTFKATIK